MVATETFLKRNAFLIFAALVAAAPASAQLNVSPTTVNLSGSTQFVTVNVTSTTGADVPFTIAKAAGNVFYTIQGNPTSGTAPANGTAFTFTVGLGTISGCSTQACTGTITLTPTSGTAVPITVIFTPGGGGGGGSAITVDPNPPATLSAVQGLSATGSVNLRTANGGALTCSISSNVTWLVPASNSLNLTGSPQTLFYTAYSTGLANNTQNSATVTICPSTTAQTQFTVTFNVGNPSGGTGTLSVSPSTLTLVYPSGPTSATVGVSSNNVNVNTYLGYVNNVSWLLLNGASQVTSAVSISSGAVVSVNGNAAATLTAGTYTGQIVLYNPANSADYVTITVTLQANGGGSGGGVITVNPSSVTLNVAQGSSTTGSVNLSTSGSTLNCSVSSNQSWLLPQSYNIQLTSSAQTFYVYGYGTGLQNNTQYNGTITLSCTTTSTQFNVTMNVGTGGGSGGINVNPGSVTLNVVQGSSTSGSVNLSTTGATLSCSVSSSQSWLLPQAYSVTLTSAVQTFYVYGYATGLANNTQYTGTITLSCSSTSTQFNVTMNVGNAGGGGSNAIAAPTSLTFAYQTGEPLPQSQNITVAAAGSFNATTSVSTSQQWLDLSLSGGGTTTSVSGTAPALLTVTVDPTNLSAGVTYQGTITITTTAGTQTVQVNLMVTSGVVIQGNPGSINFSWQPGGGSPQQYFQLAASDGSAQSVTLSTQANWITISSGGATATPATYLITLNPASLCNGVNSATLNFTATGVTNSTGSIPVVVLVSNSNNTNCGGGGSSGYLTLGATAFTFNGTSNGSVPASQTLGVSAGSLTAFVTQISTTSGGSWLFVSQGGTAIPSGSTLYTPANLVISVNPAGLAATTYSGLIALTANGITQNVSVSFVVAASGGVTVSPASVSMSPNPGGATVSRDVQVTNATGTSGVTFTVTSTTTSGGNWLSVGTNSGGVVTPVTSGTSLTPPVTLTISANPQSLAASTTYQGTVTLTPNSGSAVQIAVTVTTTATPTVSAAPANGGTTMAFTYRAGDQAPSPQNITVSGGQGLTFSATAQSNGSWLVVSPAAGTTPGSVSVTISASGLAAGQYNGSVTVAGTGTAAGSTTISVSLTVTAPLPTITQIGNAGSYVGGSISPGEIITIFGTGLGPTPAIGSPTLDSSGRVTTILGGVQVSINGFQAPMLYASSTQVSAVVPYDVARYLSATILVQFLGQTSNGISAGVASTAPGIFTANSSGTGPGAILNGNLTLNSTGNPANKGETVAIYMTGEGQTAPTGVNGKVTTLATTGPLTPQPLLPVAVTVDGQPAAVAFYGEAPGLVSGVMQINVMIPLSSRPGNLPLKVTIGNNQSQDGVTVSVK